MSFTNLVDPAVRFQHWHDIESTPTVFDGANVKLSVDGGATFFEIDPGAVSPAYSGTVRTAFSNPLGGQLAWAGRTGEWRTVLIELGPDLETLPKDQVVLRFDFGADTTVQRAGWYIDEVTAGELAALP